MTAILKHARDYLFANGRAVDQARFQYHFEAADNAAVFEALAAFQNADGGFGNAIEPDIRTTVSSAIGTSTGFDTLREVGASADHALVKRAVAYLEQTFEKSTNVWPIIPPEVDAAPAAFWWDYASSAESFGNFLVNPRFALIGHLTHFSEAVSADFLTHLQQLAQAHLATVDAASVEMYDFYCYRTLATANNLAPALRDTLHALLSETARHLVSPDPEKWGDHGIAPLDAAPAADAVLATAIGRDALDANADQLCAAQLDDGSWPVPWSWEAKDAVAWAQAERDWKGVMLVNNLITLRSFGRL